MRKNAMALPVILIAGLFALGCESATETEEEQLAGSWKTVASMPDARWALTVSAVDGKAYAFGGAECGYTSHTFDDVYEYDPELDSWSVKQTMLSKRYSTTSAAVAGKIYLIGGEAGAGSADTLVESYDPSSDEWSSETSMPSACAEAGCASLNGLVYVVGGRPDGWTPLDTVRTYDPAAKSWTAKASMPTPRYGLACCVLDGILYAIGGVVVEDYAADSCATVESYDPASNTWTICASMLTRRENLAVGVLGEYIYAIGGETNGDAETTGKTAERYDPVANKWTSVASLPVSCQGMGSCEIGGKIYIFGGAGEMGDTGYTTYDTAYEFTAE